MFGKKWIYSIAGVVGIGLCVLLVMSSLSVAQEEGKSKLAVVWSSGDPYVAHRVCLMYTHGAKKQDWFDQVNLIVWGPSAKLLSEDEEIQAKLHAMQEDGVKLEACVVCADAYGVSEKLKELGLEVKAMGKPLTERLKGNWEVITF